MTVFLLSFRNGLHGGGEDIPLFEGMLCKALKTPFFSSSPKGPLKLFSVTQRPHVFFCISDQKFQFCDPKTPYFGTFYRE